MERFWAKDTDPQKAHVEHMGLIIYFRLLGLPIGRLNLGQTFDCQEEIKDDQSQAQEM